ncbi:hypothetical protein BWI17_19485 [Betaproteobacteria bacterium GR16-43]|nr:hypothetical protein BWI17_19485 [Betaproteobacteria bacterium GR16-43]
MASPHRTLSVAVLLASLALLPGTGLAQQPKAPAKESAAKNLTVTGQNRGYTNKELYLRLDNEKEMTFVVEIPGDKTDAWHDQFKMFSRITVTYHDVPGKKPVATAIANAP